MKISLCEWLTILIWQSKFVVVQFYNLYIATRLQA